MKNPIFVNNSLDVQIKRMKSDKTETNIMTMPPIVQKNFCPIYRLDYLITKKSYTDKVSQRTIRKDICSVLGGITLKHLWRIRRAQVGESSILSADDLIQLAKYFSCTLDDLVVASSPTDPGSPDASPEVAGIISNTNPTPQI